MIDVQNNDSSVHDFFYRNKVFWSNKSVITEKQIDFI